MIVANTDKVVKYDIETVSLLLDLFGSKKQPTLALIETDCPSCWNTATAQQAVIQATKKIPPEAEVLVPYGRDYWKHSNENKQMEK